MRSMAKRTTCGTVRQTPTEPFRAQPKCINPKESPLLSWPKKLWRRLQSRARGNGTPFPECACDSRQELRPYPRNESEKAGHACPYLADKADYDKIQEHDLLSVIGLPDFAPGRNLTVVLHHEDGTKESFEAQHTYNEQQIAWFRAGSALNAR